MDAKAETLLKMYEASKRYTNFGEVICRLDINGIKGTNCSIPFDFPITAISGYNGAGKSTIAQIALCAYKEAETNSRRSYLKDFFVKTLLDKQPYLPDARIVVSYACEEQQEHAIQLSIFSNDETDRYAKHIQMYYATDRWEGYRYQPSRRVFYFGMSYFIPYQELNSNLLRDGRANIRTIKVYDSRIVKLAANILSIAYTELQNNKVVNEKRETQVISAKKSSIAYSENHMGCGEGRLLKLIDALENAPNQSLFVIEEPETALHQLAQHKLSQYFLDVCLRKRHQIIFTTHSSDLLTALPPQGRKFLIRGESQSQVVNNPTIAEVTNLLSGGNNKGLTIVTEDRVAAEYLKEIIRNNAHLFDNCSIYPLDTSYSEVKKYVEYARRCSFAVCGVVDESRRTDIKKFIAAIPEDNPPEETFFGDENIRKFLLSEYGFDCAKQLPQAHHEFFSALSSATGDEIGYLLPRIAKEYVKSRPKGYFDFLCKALEEWLGNLK